MPGNSHPTIRWEHRAARTVDFLAEVGDEYADIQEDVDWRLLDVASQALPIDSNDGNEIHVHRYPVEHDSDVLIFWQREDEHLISVFYVRLDDDDREFNNALQQVSREDPPVDGLP